MPKAIDLTGKKFGKLTAIERDYSVNKNNAYWKCQCECGNYTSVSSNNLRKVKNGVKSCGCLRKEIGNRSIKDLSGQRFDKLLVLSITDKRVGERVVWHCKCDCGTEIDVSSDALLKGHTHSCGCIKSIGEKNIATVLSENNIVFEKEKKFPDLIFNSYLRYDFYIPDYNRLVEFDGIQHFEDKANGSWKQSSCFEEVQKRDMIKNQYALSHGIDLVRIPYWERDNITLEMILGDKYIYMLEEEM